MGPPDEEGEDYKGGRSLADLKKFAANELGPGCSVDTIDNCSDEQKKEMKTELSAAEAKHEALLKELQATYKESMDSLEKLKETSAPKIKLLKAATPTPPKDAPKDEV